MGRFKKRIRNDAGTHRNYTVMLHVNQTGKRGLYKLAELLWSVSHGIVLTHERCPFWENVIVHNIDEDDENGEPRNEVPPSYKQHV